jgi:hypothetical protein
LFPYLFYPLVLSLQIEKYWGVSGFFWWNLKNT